MELQLLAYHKWAIRESGKDRNALAGILLADIIEDKNPLAFELLEATGDKDYTADTFLKAADLLLKADQR